MTDHDPEYPFFRQMRAQILDTPLPRRRRRLRRDRHGLTTPRRFPLWPLAGASAALVATLTLLTLVLGAGSSPSPAYAVTINPNHGVTIYLLEFRDLRKLNARLAALGTRIRVVPVIPGCVAPVHPVIGAYDGVPAHVAPGPAKTLQALPPQHGTMIVSETIETDTLPGRTLVIPVTRSGLQTGVNPPGVTAVIGPAPRCVGKTHTGRR